MRSIVKLVVFSLSVYLAGCCGSDSSRTQAEHPDTSMTVSPVRPPPAAIAQNIARIRAVIESVTLIDNLQYSVKVFVLSSEPVSGRFNLIEPEQRVTIYPEFVSASTGRGIDPENPKNKRLLLIRNATMGQSFTAKISIDNRGAWRLLEIEEF